jgi:hypothetical protein
LDDHGEAQSLEPARGIHGGIDGKDTVIDVVSMPDSQRFRFLIDPPAENAPGRSGWRFCEGVTYEIRGCFIGYLKGHDDSPAVNLP